MIGGSGSVAKRADSSGADMRCLTPAITGDKTGAKRRVWHPVHGLVMFRFLVIRAASHSARLE